MTENIFHAQPVVTKKSKIISFYKSNKKIVYSIIVILVFILISLGLYSESNKNKKIRLSENYLQAKIYLEENNKDKALQILKQVIFENNPTYSSLCLFLIINENLVEDKDELLSLFNHLLENNEFSKELKNLLIYKKALFSSSFVEETELLDLLNPLLNKENLWHPHTLMLLGNYFQSKNENTKAREFYQKIFLLKNLHNDFYNQAKHQLALISNE